MQEKALLVVSFGTSYPETRKRTIEAIEERLCASFPQRRFYRAWTSRIICRKLRSRGESIDSVEEALERMCRDGITDVLVQTTHMLVGEEYALTMEALRAYAPRFSVLRCGAPLLAEEADLRELAAVLEGSYPEVTEGSLLAFMGHGSDHLDSPVYEALEQRFHADGFGHYCVGTVEFQPGFGPVLDRVRREKPEKVYLAPLMVVAGDHAANDMAGDEPDSWASQLRAEGVTPVCLLRGLGECPGVQEMYVRHAEKALTV